MMPNLRPIVVAALVVLVGGCGGPAYQRPDVALPGQWTADGGDANARITARWWENFRSAELTGLIDSAFVANHDLKAAASRIEAARAQAKVAGAGLWPQLNGIAAGSRERGSDRKVSADSHVGLAASYEIDAWGRNRSLRDAAQGRAQGSAFAREALRVSLAAEVANAYFRALSALDRRALARESLANSEAVLRLLQTQHRAGAISGLEVSRQQNLVATIEAQLPALDLEHRLALNALAVLTGRAPQGFSIAATGLASLGLPAVGAGIPSELLVRRPDIRQAETELVAAHADIAAARAAFFPSIQLTADGGIGSPSLLLFARPETLVYTLAASLVAPIFDGGRRAGQLDFAGARRDELVHLYRQAILSALRDVEDGLAANRELAAQAAKQQEALDHALAARRIAEQRFRSGGADYSTVLDAQRVVLAAQAAQEATTLARFVAAVGLYRALGGGWEVAPVGTVAAVAPASEAHRVGQR